MAQPVATTLEDLGTVQVTGGEQYLSSDFVTGDFVGATHFVMKSKGQLVNGTREQVMVSINNTPMCPVEYNESSKFDSTRSPALKYKFSQNCIILICKELP